MRIKSYDIIALFALVFSGFMLWATHNAWALINGYGKYAGLTAAGTLIGVFVLFISMDRHERLTKIGQAWFLVGAFAFVFGVFGGVIVPDIMRKR